MEEEEILAVVVVVAVCGEAVALEEEEKEFCRITGGPKCCWVMRGTLCTVSRSKVRYRIVDLESRLYDGKMSVSKRVEEESN